MAKRPLWIPTFTLTEVEAKAAEAWRRRHRCVQTPRFRSLAYIFTPTGIGSVVEVVCRQCFKAENVTDYSTW